jgi:hypothetical protein
MNRNDNYNEKLRLLNKENEMLMERTKSLHSENKKLKKNLDKIKKEIAQAPHAESELKSFIQMMEQDMQEMNDNNLLLEDQLKKNLHVFDSLKQENGELMSGNRRLLHETKHQESKIAELKE